MYNCICTNNWDCICYKKYVTWYIKDVFGQNFIFGHPWRVLWLALLYTLLPQTSATSVYISVFLLLSVSAFPIFCFLSLLQSKSFISSSPSNHFPVFVGNHRLVPVTYYYLLLYSLQNVFDCMWLSFCIHDDVGKDDVVRIEKGNSIFFCFILWFAGYNLQTAVQFH